MYVSDRINHIFEQILMEMNNCVHNLNMHKTVGHEFVFKYNYFFTVHVLSIGRVILHKSQYTLSLTQHM